MALEHARAIGSKALGQASAILLTVHNTPFGDIVDTEDDLQPLVFSMFKDANRAVRLVAAAMASAEFDRGRLAARAEEGWITVTELADTLTRDHGVPFKTSHTIASRLVAECTRRPAEPRAAVLREVTAAVIGQADRLRRGRARRGVERAPLRGGADDARRSGAVGNRARDRGFAGAVGIGRALAQRDEREIAGGGAAAERSGSQHMSRAGLVRLKPDATDTWFAGLRSFVGSVRL